MNWDYAKNILLLTKLPPTHFSVEDGFITTFFPLYVSIISQGRALLLPPLHFLLYTTTRCSSSILYFSQLYFDSYTARDGTKHFADIKSFKSTNSRNSGVAEGWEDQELHLALSVRKCWNCFQTEKFLNRKCMFTKEWMNNLAQLQCR